MGKWHEIARYMNNYETECFGGTAEYEKINDRSFKVINTCSYLKLDEKGEDKVHTRKIEGIAKISKSGQIKVSFFKPFYADYNVVYVNNLISIVSFVFTKN